MTSFTTTTLNYPQLQNTAIRRTKFPGPPTKTVNYILGDEFLDTSATPKGRWWILTTNTPSGLAWVRKAGGFGDIEALQGNTGGPVTGDSNFVIHTIGAAPYTVAGSPSTHTLTWSDNGGIAYHYTADVGTATPAANNLNIFGTAGNVTTSGSGSTITINTGGAVATSYPCNTGTAVPALGVLNVLGGTDCTTVGSGNTITINVTGTQFAFAYTNVTHAMSPYTVLASDFYLSVDTSGGVVTLNFPNAPTAKQFWIVKDRTGTSSTSNITLTTAGGVVTIDGATSYLIASNHAAVNILANATPTYEIF